MSREFELWWVVFAKKYKDIHPYWSDAYVYLNLAKLKPAAWEGWQAAGGK